MFFFGATATRDRNKHASEKYIYIYVCVYKAEASLCVTQRTEEGLRACAAVVFAKLS